MTLAFSNYWPKRMGELAGQPTRFVEMIQNGINPGGQKVHGSTSQQKLHTIRIDKNERWREGMDIHFVINNRTKDRYQFMPVIKCTGVQEITISNEGDLIYTHIGKRLLPMSVQVLLARNDGFPNLVTFWDWFVPNKGDRFKGRIIHWTAKRY